jgi:hypothetical protein
LAFGEQACGCLVRLNDDARSAFGLLCDTQSQESCSDDSRIGLITGHQSSTRRIRDQLTKARIDGAAANQRERIGEICSGLENGANAEGNCMRHALDSTAQHGLPICIEPKTEPGATQPSIDERSALPGNVRNEDRIARADSTFKGVVGLRGSGV